MPTAQRFCPTAIMFEALGEHNQEDSFRSFAARALNVLGELGFVVSTVARRTLWKELYWTKPRSELWRLNELST